MLFSLAVLPAQCCASLYNFSVFEINMKNMYYCCYCYHPWPMVSVPVLILFCGGPLDVDNFVCPLMSLKLVLVARFISSARAVGAKGFKIWWTEIQLPSPAAMALGESVWYLDFSYLGLFVPWTIRTITGRFVPCCKTDKN